MTELLERLIKGEMVNQKNGLQAWIGSKAGKKRIEGSSAKGMGALLSKLKGSSFLP